jgi:hypothetical protein
MRAARKELAPYDADWYYIRAASIARKVYLSQGLGVGMLSRVYGGGRRNGVRPKHFQRSSRGLLRHILHQLESSGIVEKMEERRCVVCRHLRVIPAVALYLTGVLCFLCWQRSPHHVAGPEGPRPHCPRHCVTCVRAVVRCERNGDMLLPTLSRWSAHSRPCGPRIRRRQTSPPTSSSASQKMPRTAAQAVPRRAHRTRSCPCAR